MTIRAIYAPASAGAQLEQLFDGIHAEAKTQGAPIGQRAASSTIRAIFDSVSPDAIPKPVSGLIEKLEGKSMDKAPDAVLDSVMLGMEIYKSAHGTLPTADVIEAALQQGSSAVDKLFDGVGNTNHSDPLAAMPNAVVTAITMAMAEAIPFAGYLPADINSNESRLAIVSHQAGSTFGDYNVGDLMDGVQLGGAYMGAERRIPLTTADNSAFTGQITARNGVAGSGGVPLLPGRAIVFINGIPVATENTNVGASVPKKPVSGSVVIGSTSYTISGTVTTATGLFEIAVTPALPANTPVAAEGYIDYELTPALTPEFMTQVQVFQLFAAPWRGVARQSIDSRTQYQNEIKVDLLSESSMSLRNQFAQERHYAALGKLKELAINTQTTFNFDYSLQSAQKTRAQVWQDALTPLGELDQLMAEKTMDHGITHLYCTRTIAAQLQSLDRTLFEPSGITARPGIYRVGRLFGRFEVYYTPKGLSESADRKTAQILAIGRSTQVARNPIVMGDSVPATVLPLARNSDLKEGIAFYGRNFTQVNPHQPSAMGAALLTVTNML